MVYVEIKKEHKLLEVGQKLMVEDSYFELLKKKGVAEKVKEPSKSSK